MFSLIVKNRLTSISTNITTQNIILTFYTSPTSDRYKRGGVAVWRLREERKTAGGVGEFGKRLYICKSKIITQLSQVNNPRHIGA